MGQQEEIFKVVKIEGDKCLSAMETGTNQLEYKPNTITKPKRGKIFAFSSIACARLFIVKNLDLYLSYEIWKARGKNPEKISIICVYPKKDEEFWKGLIKDVYLGQSPEGAIVVEEIELLEQVE